MEQREPEEEELTRMVREGVRPATVNDRMKLFGAKLAGDLPMGVDAPDKTARKVIGGGWKLLAVLKHGFLGSLLTLFGALCVWAGSNGQFQVKIVATGAVMLVVGLWALRSAYRSWQNFRAISKA